MSKTGRRSLWLPLSLVAGMAGVAALALFLSPLPSGEGEATGGLADDERVVNEAALARIEAESRGASAAPSVQAAPRGADNALPAEPPADHRPAPPEGYSFVTDHGEMAKGRLERGADAQPDAVEPSPAWLGAPDAVAALAGQAATAGRGWTFGWIQLQPDARAGDLRRSLQRLGGEVLGAAGHLVRVQLPGDKDSLRAIAALPEVAGLGAMPGEKKLSAAFAEEAFAKPGHERTPVFITLMTDDPDGRWRRSLQDLGAVVGHFDPAIRVYAANVDQAALEAIAEADFVLAVEPVGVVEAAHDTAVPAMGADALRQHLASPGLFSGIGGASVPVGVMDTGLNTNHFDISANRESICGANFVWYEPRVDDEDLWVDTNWHGTHVTGTIAGNGHVKPQYAGMAPSVRHIRFAKVLSHRGYGSSTGIVRGMDFLARASACANAGWSADRVRPLVVNMSLSSTSRLHEGRDVGARKLDSVVWGHRQLYVVAQSNSSIHGFSNYGAAKNSLSVGAARDSGELAYFSSHGPTADGRLAPQVVATGAGLYSAQGGGSRSEYVSLSGTSMASPAVAGVAALLMDAVPGHREQPALVRARLMASAIKPDAWLEADGRFPLSNSNGPGALQARYGLGKVSARTSVLNRDEPDGWVSGGAVSELRDGEYAHQEIVVPEGASRLDLVMVWDEPPTDTIAQAVLNDLDLYLDRDGDCGAGACGEYSSTSRKDNVEWIIVRNPPPGTYRAKVVSHRVYTAAPRAGLAWTVIRGASTPQLAINADRKSLADGDTLRLTLTTDTYVAAGTLLHMDCRTPDGVCPSSTYRATATREDAVSRDFDWSNRRSVELGEIAAGESQQIAVEVYLGSEPSRHLHFTASAWNAKAASVSVDVLSDDGADGSGAPPAEAAANAEFAAASVLKGGEGLRELDLLLAVPEPGEPVFEPGYGRPFGSVWYVWTAPADGLSRFGATRNADVDVDYLKVRVDVFRGERIGALEHVASGRWGAEFFAEAGRSYRIRVSNYREAVPLVLRWSQGPRPANDDFGAALSISDAEGVAEGDSQGATLEPGESFGALASTVWYRWTAPGDGWWKFESSNKELRVLAFTGDSIGELRLVSGYPGSLARFPAVAGGEYHIAVASPTVYAAGGFFDLVWAMTEPTVDNDNIEAAETIDGVASGSHYISSSPYRSASVEPGEPAATGVRTRWWVWTAPEDGRFTWRLTETANIETQVAVFSRDADQNLRLIGATGPVVTSTELAFQAVRGERYWISVGLPKGDYRAFSFWGTRGILRWGSTPENDDLDRATSLAGASGSITGLGRFATTEPDQRGGLGHSSVWYGYQAPTAGWYRYWVEESRPPMTLAVYVDAGGGLGSLELVTTSRRGPKFLESDVVEVLFYTEPGVRYAIRIGTLGANEGGRFSLYWEEAEPPVWLRYAGRVTHGDMDSTGRRVALGELAELAVNDLGTALYAASGLGLHVFERDATTGNLTPVQLLEKQGSLAHAPLIWDPRRAQLYAVDNCSIWRRFSPIDGTHQRLGDGETLSVDSPVGSYCVADAFMDSDGEFIYVVHHWARPIWVFAFDAEGDLRHVQTFEIDGIRHALISNDETRVYAATSDGSLVVLARDGETGKLARIGEADQRRASRSMDISADDRYLFAIGPNQGAPDINLFQFLRESADPLFLSFLPPVDASLPWWNQAIGRCFATVRNAAPAVDVLCGNAAFSVEWRPDANELVATDYVAAWQPDRFNNPVPKFGHAKGMAASPDGRHVYLATENDGILIFERVGNAVADAGAAEDDGHVQLYVLSVSSGSVSFGPLSSGGCIGLVDTTLDGVTYSIGGSRWRTRDAAGGDWADVEGTATTGEVCAHTPSAPGEYRLVAEITIDGETGRYRSNTLVVDQLEEAGDEPTASFSSRSSEHIRCMMVGGRHLVGSGPDADRTFCRTLPQ